MSHAPQADGQRQYQEKEQHGQPAAEQFRYGSQNGEAAGCGCSEAQGAGGQPAPEAFGPFNRPETAGPKCQPAGPQYGHPAPDWMGQYPGAGMPPGPQAGPNRGSAQPQGSTPDRGPQPGHPAHPAMQPPFGYGYPPPNQGPQPPAGYQPSGMGPHAGPYSAPPGGYDPRAFHSGYGTGAPMQGCGQHAGYAGAGGHGAGNQYGALYGLIREAADGNPDVSKFMNFFHYASNDFWKGALVGTALTLLLTNDGVKNVMARSLASVLTVFGTASQPESDNTTS